MTETRSRRRKREDTDLDESAGSPQLPAKRRQVSASKKGTPRSATAPLALVLPPVRVTPPVDGLERDPEFYRDDGNCILRVKDTLFKVHILHLSAANEGSAFADLFTLPVPPFTTPEGTHDSSPIILEGDTVEELRAFFGYAYASPLQLWPSRIADADLQRLVNTLRFVHKYRLESFERWAKETISAVTLRNERAALKQCPAQVLVSLLEVNTLSRIPRLRQRITDTWLWRLGQYDEWPQNEITLMLGIGHRLNLRSFLGSVYYAQLRRVNAVQFSASDPCPIAFEVPGLGELDTLRLLKGHRSLSLFWDRLISELPPLNYWCDQSRRCRCDKKWAWEWNEARLMTLNTAAGREWDVVRNVSDFQDNLCTRGESTTCTAVGGQLREALEDVQKMLVANLVDHFLGPATIANTA
ncbi:hypothetical protein B0H16DRAFT_241716 [Mycena metata]|uniref:BTB domain-containing protein n=1 Tax=Mycena metata TaxID=1033252 RepID=A0AAD7MRA7_9AGAR|nr:hypothetical protein B0H16DRAFT_241716 [Mycena metata]